jgi:hypothetical protein
VNLRWPNARITFNNSKTVSIYSILLHSLLPRLRIGTSTTITSTADTTSVLVSLSSLCARTLLSLAVLQLRFLLVDPTNLNTLSSFFDASLICEYVLSLDGLFSLK